MKPPRIYKTPHTCDLDPEARVALLLARISHDLQVMYEPPDLGTPEAAAHALVMLDSLLATLESHRCVIKALITHLQKRRLSLGPLGGSRRHSVTELVTAPNS